MKNRELNNQTSSTQFEGTTIVYRTNQGRLDINSADFKVSIGSAKHPKQFRAYRLRRIKSGKSTPKIAENALHRDVILISGAGASPNFVVSWLYSMISDIKKHGLVVGIKANGKFAREAFDPDKKIRKRPDHKKGPVIFQI